MKFKKTREQKERGNGMAKRIAARRIADLIVRRVRQIDLIANLKVKNEGNNAVITFKHRYSGKQYKVTVEEVKN